MPCCIVKQCHSWTGRKKVKENVILHVFPKNFSRIKEWLAKTQQYSAEDIEVLSQKIMQTKKNDNYRICSKHFTDDSYLIKGDKKVLLPSAVPTLFGHDSFQRHSYSSSTCSLEESSGTETNQPVAGPSKRKRSNKSKKILIEASTQTDNVCADQGTQVPEFQWTQAEPEAVGKDHNYTFLQSTPIKSHIDKHASIPTTVTPIKPTDPMSNLQLEHDSSLNTENLDTDDLFVSDISNLYDPNDSDFIVGKDTLEHISVDELDSTLESRVPDVKKSSIEDRKFIVFETCLDSLFYKVQCQASECNCLVTRFRKITEGSYLTVTGYCAVGHRFKLFESQPKVNNYSTGNILLAAAVLFTGCNINRIHEFLDILGVQQISQRTFFRYQRKFLFKSVHHFWEKERKLIRENIGKHPVALAGDGQCDSPGFTAKYCTYSFSDLATNKIVDFEIVQRSETSSSNAMENVAFQRCLDRIIQEGIDVCVVATDKHPSIKKTLESDKYTINHQLDIWHYAKNIRKKIIAASKRKQCKDLGLWVESIIRHFWWCVRNCQGDEELLREMWVSVLHHTVNQHRWRGSRKYFKCSHGRLSKEQSESKEWLLKDSAAYLQLTDIVTNPILIGDLQRLVNNCHTGMLECYHSKMLKFRTKRIHFTMDSMVARTSLAVLSHNFNTNRQQAVVKRQTTGGAQVGEKRTSLVFPRSRKRWVVRTIYEKTSNEHLFHLMEDLLNIVEGNLLTTYESVTDTLPRNLATVEKPDKASAVAEHQSRF
uniref:THAP-type domain-containing protein n=1 Tax=Xenopus tropicalis TaxID=8364 RepID=A0A803JQR1_XENTR